MSDIAKGITDCLDTINKLRDENTAQAVRIETLEAALHKIAERTKRAHSQAQEGEIHHIAITALAGSTK